MRITPPPMTTASSSKIVASEAIPMPSQRPRRAKMSSAVGSPCCAAAVTVCPVTTPVGAAEPGDQPVRVRGGRLAAHPRQRACPRPPPPGSRGCPQPQRGPSGSTIMWSELGAHARRAAVDLPVQHEAAADAGADGDEQHLPVGRPPSRASAKPATFASLSTTAGSPVSRSSSSRIAQSR